MEFNTASNIVIGIIILILFSYVLMGAWIRRKESENNELWQILLLKIRERTDVLPLLLQRLAILGILSELENGLKMRWEAEMNSVISDEKNHAEKKISAITHKIISACEKSDAVKKDIVAENQLQELKRVSNELKIEVEKFNAKILSYNKYFKIFLFTPLFLVINVKPLKTLDFGA